MKERYQNPVIRDEIRLRLFSYNSNNRANVGSISKVEIYFLDPEEKSESNPDGRRLVQTIEDVTQEETGLYSVTFTAESELFTIGQYVDVWHVTVGTESAKIENYFQIFPDLWFTTPIPIIYDFNFSFRPNQLRKGAKRYLAVEIMPNVPDKDQLYSYYQNLAITSPIKISIEQECVACMPEETDLRLVIDEESVELREKCAAYYFLDTTDLEIGVYNVWFKIEMGESVYISDKQQLIIN